MDPPQFIEELSRQIICTVKKDPSCNLTSERFYREFNPQESLFVGEVEYGRHNTEKIFEEKPNGTEEIFWKSQDYAWQSEVRFTIPNLNYVQTYDPKREYDVGKNQLDIYLTHFHKYAEVLGPQEKHRWINFVLDDNSEKLP